MKSFAVIPAVFFTISVMAQDSSAKKSDWSFSAGLAGSPSISLRAKHTRLAQNYYYVNGIEFVRDTIYNLEDQDGKLVLPFNIGVGFAFKEGTKWIAGADFSLQNWQDYSLFGDRESE